MDYLSGQFLSLSIPCSMGNVRLFFLLDVDSFYYSAIPDVLRFCYSVKTESRVLHKPSVYCLFTPKPQHLLNCFKISWETGNKFGSSPSQFISAFWKNQLINKLFFSQLSPKKCHSFRNSCYWLAKEKHLCTKVYSQTCIKLSCIKRSPVKILEIASLTYCKLNLD